MSFARFNIGTLIFLIASFSTLFFLSSCDKHEEEPKKTKIYGTVTVNNINTWSVWKDSGVVELTVFPKFSLNPLAGWGEVPDNFFGPNVLGGTFAVGAPYNAQNPVIFTYQTGKNTFAYEIELEPGNYSALALGFRHNRITNPNLKTATLGVHYNKPTEVSHGIIIKVKAGPSTVKVFDYLPPVSFDIAEGEQKEINFTADFDFVKKWYR